MLDCIQRRLTVLLQIRCRTIQIECDVQILFNLCVIGVNRSVCFIQKLRRIGRDYQTPLQLHIDIMAVLAGLSEGSAQDVIIAVLAAGLDKETNSVLQNIRKFGSIEAFWQLARKYTGYIEEEDKPLGYFAAHVLLTALSQTMNASVLKGLERFVSETNKVPRWVRLPAVALVR